MFHCKGGLEEGPFNYCRCQGLALVFGLRRLKVVAEADGSTTLGHHHGQTGEGRVEVGRFGRARLMFHCKGGPEEGPFSYCRCQGPALVFGGRRLKVVAEVDVGQNGTGRQGALKEQRWRTRESQ